ncbi:MAG: N-acetylneuraminate synthase [Muribaculaceae bacterium]|nr:N-acetylneuraminate synthase [Muribaculaceae bacterium]
MKRTIIIAEAGVNHNGSLDRALELVDAAAQAGADYVKFQTFKASALVNAQAQQAKYQKINTGAERTQLEMLSELELSYEDFVKIASHCRYKGIRFLSTPFDLESLEFLKSLNMDFWKIPSGEITNLPYLRAIGVTGKPVVMSTGMCTPDDIHAAIIALERAGTAHNDITLLHCTTEYPAPYSEVNLAAMNTLASRFHTPVGYSDHTRGIEIAIAAAALGATVVEKHFTLDRNLPGPDHKASLEPAELSSMVTAIRNVDLAIGSPEKLVTEAERRNMTVARKSIVAARDICKGELLSTENLTVKRPGTGISPMLWDTIIGTVAKKDFTTDELISI